MTTMEIDKYDQFAHYICKRLIIKTPEGVVRLSQEDGKELIANGKQEAIEWLKEKVKVKDSSACQ